MARINLESMLDRMQSRNEAIRKYLMEAESRDSRNSEELERIFFCIREATMFLEMQKIEVDKISKSGQISTERCEGEAVKKVLAEFYSLSVRRDKLVKKI